MIEISRTTGSRIIHRADHGGLVCLASLLNLDQELVTRHARQAFIKKHTKYFTGKECSRIWTAICRERAEKAMMERRQVYCEKMGWGPDELAAWPRG